ncbi:MAG: hypothetical protein U9Q99_01850 [Nanoarchaeota archaeon]|nr:hypothetical protein [Nanoarchaeota archaeon]
MEKIKSFAKKHPVWSVIILLVVIGFIGSLFSSPDTNTNSQPTTTTQQNNEETTRPPVDEPSNAQDSTEESIEDKLATINAGKYIEKDDITINRFRYLLDTLEKKTKNTKQEIADMSVAALEKVAKEKYGLDITLLELMEGANNSIPEEAMGTDAVNYAEIVVLYIELIK